jgi:hypothetical protein
MLEGNVVERNNITGRMGAQGSIRVEQYSSMDLSAELVGSGTAGAASHLSPLFKAGGMMETLTVGTNAVYSPVSSGFQSVTLAAYYKDDSGAVKRALLTGSRASFAIDLSAGTAPKIDFKFQGLFNNPETATALSGDFSGIPLPKGANKANTVSASLFGEQVQAEKINLDAGINIKYSNLINYEGVDYIGRSGKLTVSFLVPTVDAMATWVSRGKDNAQGAFSVTHGTTAGNIVSLSVPNAQIKTVTPSFQDDRMFISVDMDIVPLTDNGDFTITLS